MKRCVKNFANVPRTSSGFLLTQYAFRAQKRYHPGQMSLGHLKKNTQKACILPYMDIT